MQPFNLDRFRAGEPAYHKDTHEENFYLADLPDNRIVLKYFNDIDGWGSKWGSIERAQDRFYMKEKELTWEEVRNMWLTSNMASPNFYRWCEQNLEPPKLKNK